MEKNCFMCEKKYEPTKRPIQPGDEFVCPSCEPKVKALQFAAVQEALALLGKQK
jgi:DNA-directed RNA polymerase subunit RPC12/RpoP